MNAPGNAAGEIVATDAELAAVQAELEYARASYKAFAYSISHDLRAPLRAIAGFTNMVQESATGELGDDTRRFLDIISENVQILSAQMDGLLAISRLEHRELRPSTVDMTSVACTAVEQVRALEPGRQVRLTIDALPPAMADPDMMRIAMLELAKNAWKFTRTQPSATISITSETDADETIYRISDDGVGFAPASADRLFVAFRRLHSAKQYDGIGIGLALVKTIATRHRGRVFAESTPEGGATFGFSLPRG